MNLPELFDYKFYSDRYPDLKNAFGYNEELLKKHYLVHGQFENRKFCNMPDDFDWKKYINDNPSVFNTMETKTKKNAIQHFLTNNNQINTTPLTPYVITLNKPIIILYYVFLNSNKDWKNMIGGQIHDIIKSKILDVTYRFHIVVSGNKNSIDELKYFLRNNYNNIAIDYTEVYENKYEFPAIKKIRDLAIENPDKIFIYLHTKGMVFNNPSSLRTLTESKLTLNTFLDWETTLFIFETYPEIQKAGMVPNKEGFIYFNFWWARGSYLIKCDPIEIKDTYEEQERFICESWLKTGSFTWEDTYSVIRKQIYAYSDNFDMPLWKETPELFI